jgi:hypothetical protein
VGTTEGEGEVGLREGEGKIPQECTRAGVAHFAATVAIGAGAGTGLSPSPFCVSGVGWGSRCS